MVGELEYRCEDCIKYENWSQVICGVCKEREREEDEFYESKTLQVVVKDSIEYRKHGFIYCRFCNYSKTSTLTANQESNLTYLQAYRSSYSVCRKGSTGLCTTSMLHSMFAFQKKISVTSLQQLRDDAQIVLGNNVQVHQKVSFDVKFPRLLQLSDIISKKNSSWKKKQVAIFHQCSSDGIAKFIGDMIRYTLLQACHSFGGLESLEDI